VGTEVEFGVGVALGAEVPTGVDVGEEVGTIEIGVFDDPPPPPPHATSDNIIIAEIKGETSFSIGSSFLRMKTCVRAVVRCPVETGRLK